MSRRPSNLRFWAGALLALPAFAADEPRLEIDSGGHQASISVVSFTHDGKFLISAGDDKVVRVWDLASGKTVRKILGPVGDGPVGFIYAAALSPDDRYLAIGGFLSSAPNEGVIRVHDFRSGEVVALLKGHTDVVTALAFSRDGHYLVSGSEDKTVRLWDANSWTQLKVLSGHRDSIYSVAFSPDNQRVISASDDKTLRLWSRDGQMLKEMAGHQGLVKTVRFSPDGQFIASGSTDQTIRLWDGKTGEFVKVLANQGSGVFGLSFSPDSKILAAGTSSGDLVCHTFEIPSGRLIASFSGHKNLVYTTAFSPDGKQVASGGGNENEIRIWNPLNGQEVGELVGAGNRVWAVGFGLDGQSIAFGTKLFKGPLEKTVLLDTGIAHSFSVGEPVRDEAEFVRATRSRGDLALTVRTGDVYESNILQISRAGNVIYEIPRNALSGFVHIEYGLSPDGSLAASARSGGYLSIYSTGTGKEVGNCIGHTDDIWSVAFSPDGKTLVSGSADQTVRLWDVSPASCKPLLAIFAGLDNEWVAWTPQGYYTSSANGDKYIGWRVNQGDDKQAQFFSAAQYKERFYRPDVVAEFLKSRDIGAAVKTANAGRRGQPEGMRVLGPSEIANHRPPHIIVAEPAGEDSKTTKPLQHVQAFAVSDDPITGFELLANGATFAGGGSLTGLSSERRIEADVPLSAGKNTLAFVASNGATQSVSRTVTYTGPGKSEKPKLILLSVGVSKYANAQFKLDWADQDAIDIEQAFLSQEGQLYSKVIHRSLLNSNVTKDNLLDGLKWLNEQGSDDDIRVLFLSGHGGLDSYGNYYFYAADHDPSRDPEGRDIEWRTLLERLTSQMRKAVLIVDTCHAGAVADGGPRPRGDVNFDQVLNEMKSRFRGLFTLAASMGAESSYEDKAWRHGAFTKALLDALQNKAAAGKVLSTDDLYKEVKDRIKILTGDMQHPRMTYTEALTGFPIFMVRN